MKYSLDKCPNVAAKEIKDVVKEIPHVLTVLLNSVDQSQYKSLIRRDGNIDTQNKIDWTKTNIKNYVWLTRHFMHLLQQHRVVTGEASVYATWLKVVINNNKVIPVSRGMAA